MTAFVDVPLPAEMPGGRLAERVRRQFAADRVGRRRRPPVVKAVRREQGTAVLGDTAVLRLAGRIHDQLVVPARWRRSWPIPRSPTCW